MEAEILTPLRTEHITGQMKWVVTDWFKFRSAVLGRDIEVPPGFVTDFHSVPRGLWNILPPHENPESGVIHDFLYVVNGCTRKEADRVHKEVLEVIDKAHPGKADGWKRQLMYLGLRVGGWRAWRKYRNKQKEGKPAQAD